MFAPAAPDAHARIALGTTLIALVVLSSATLGGASPTSWTTGQEKDLTGHTFSETSWTAEVSYANGTHGNSTTFGVSYLNKYSTQAFLVNLKVHTGPNGRQSTVPYQMFGLHYNTLLGQEVFIGSILSFLMAFNDTSNGTGPSSGSNGLPDPGLEPVYYIIPFGVSDVAGFEGYAPEVEVEPVSEVSTDHYRFEVHYRNLFAKIIDGNSVIGALLSAALPLYIAKFSELTVRYDITYDHLKGTIAAETFYTLGQVDTLWVLGKETAPRAVLTPSWGIAAVHTVAVFASKDFSFSRASDGVKLKTNIAAPTTDLQMSLGAEKSVFEIGFRGTFDKIDEANGNAVISTDTPAINGIFAARLVDLWLVGAQAPFSLDLFSVFAYALSDANQKQFSSPNDLLTRAASRFTAGVFWYGVSFPSWEGYRIVHDPVYTAHTSFEAKDKVNKITDEGRKRVPDFTLALALLGVAVPAVLVRQRRR